ncbi:MAG: hypothetical protein LBE49_06225, partial [Deltaproteobacteria bacterium]|nr:hypothetical protein [Deltaproteobacteria bacterium]
MAIAGKAFRELMFRKLFLKVKASERAEIHGLLDFVLSAIGLMLELAALELLSFGLGRIIVERFGAHQGLWGPPLAILPLCLVFMAASAPTRILRAFLSAGFGLDPRPFPARILSLFSRGLIFLLCFWLGSWAVYEAIRSADLLLWSGTLLGCLWLCVLGAYYLKRLRLSSNLRLIRPEEIPEGLGPFLEVWRRSFPKAGNLKVYDLFRPGLSMPGYLGRDLVVSAKALAAFTPDALKTGVVGAIMAQMLKLDRNYLVLRLASMALAVPGAIIILHSLGFLMGFPLVSGPRLLPLVWLAVWLARQASELIERQLEKYLCYKLNAAVVSVTGNAPALVTVIGTMARYNQVAWTSRWWSRL